jgi:hypothetical protein
MARRVRSSYRWPVWVLVSLSMGILGTVSYGLAEERPPLFFLLVAVVLGCPWLAVLRWDLSGVDLFQRFFFAAAVVFSSIFLAARHVPFVWAGLIATACVSVVAVALAHYLPAFLAARRLVKG